MVRKVAFRGTEQVSKKLVTDHQRSAYVGGVIQYCLHNKKINAPRYNWLEITNVSLK